VNPAPAEAFRLTGAERTERYRRLRQATAQAEAPLITEAGLDLMIKSATSPQHPEAFGEPLRAELEVLVQAGLIGGDGRLNPAAKDIVAAVRRPHVQLRLEVASGQSVRAWQAWLGYQRAVILAQASPAITAADSPADVAGRAPLTQPGYHLQAVIPGWVPVAGAQWLGLGPRESPAGQPQLPRAALFQRLGDPGIPVPGDDPVLARIWHQPMQLCAITVQPSGERTFLLDAASAGLWLLATEDCGTDVTAILTPLPAHAAWRLLLTLIVNADRARRAGPI
jgi:hypothetical protein